MSINLIKALKDPLWEQHYIGKKYSMDGEPGWKIAYYPIFEDGKTKEVYEKPRALVEKPTQWTLRVRGKSETVLGTDFREVPLHYLNPLSDNK